MKVRQLWFILVVVLTLGIARPASVSAGILYTFDAPDDMDLYFNAAGSDKFTEVADGGIGDSRAIRPGGASAAGTRTAKLSFPGNMPSFTISGYMRHITATNTSNQLPFVLGFGPHDSYQPTYTSGSNPDHNHFSFVLRYTGTPNDYYLQIINMEAQQSSQWNTSANPVTLTHGEWYQLAVDVSVNADDNYDATVQLFESDGDGNLGNQVAALTRNNMSNATLLNDPTVHAFIYTSASASQRGVDRIDNMLIPIPEPSTAMLMVLALAGAGWIRRRR